MGVSIGNFPRTRFTTTCAASRPGPARTARCEGKHAIFGAILTRAAQQRDISRQGRYFILRRKSLWYAAKARACDSIQYKLKGVRKFRRENLRTALAWLLANGS